MSLLKFRYLCCILLGLLVIPGVCLAGIPAPAVVHLNASASPSQGIAGSTTLYLTGTGFPAGPITPSDVTVTIAATCGGAPLATATATSAVHILGSSDRLGFVIPVTLAQGTYFASAADSTGGQLFTSGNCSAFKVLRFTGGTPAPTYFLAGNWTGTATVVDSQVENTYSVGASISQTANALTATLMVLGEDGANVYTVTGQINGNKVTFTTATNGIPDGVDASGTISADGLQVSGSDSIETGSGTMTWNGMNALIGMVSLVESGSTDVWTSTVSTDGQHLIGQATTSSGDSASWSLTRQ